MILLWALGAILILFLLVAFRGAPYVPTHTSSARYALDNMLDLPKGSTIVDLGSGDGVILKLAAERGYRAIGYELNPILCLVSYVRCWKYRHLVSVRWRDFWLSPLPKDVDAVFVFLAGPYLRRLDRKLKREHTGPLRVVSYGFAIPGAGKPAKTGHGLTMYEYR